MFTTRRRGPLAARSADRKDAHHDEGADAKRADPGNPAFPCAIAVRSVLGSAAMGSVVAVPALFATLLQHDLLDERRPEP